MLLCCSLLVSQLVGDVCVTSILMALLNWLVLIVLYSLFVFAS